MSQAGATVHLTEEPKREDRNGETRVWKKMRPAGWAGSALGRPGTKPGRRETQAPEVDAVDQLTCALL